MKNRRVRDLMDHLNDAMLANQDRKKIKLLEALKFSSWGTSDSKDQSDFIKRNTFEFCDPWKRRAALAEDLLDFLCCEAQVRDPAQEQQEKRN